MEIDLTKDEIIKNLDKIDWDFKGETTQYLSHKFHPYPARFIPQIPSTFIKLFTEEGETVLDPFCGSGTTLVESLINRRNSIGNDFNPFAVLLSKVKTTMVSDQDFEYLHKKLDHIKNFIKLDFSRIEERINNLPNRNQSKIFNKIVIEKLETLKDMILELKSEGKINLYDLCQIALSATVWSLVENGDGIDIEDTFIRKIHVMESALKEMQIKIKKPHPTTKIIQGDARKLALDSNSMDLIVTSPPYVNALDYYRTHMYNMLWLGLDFDIFRKNEIGGHSHFIYNRFRLLSEYLSDMFRAIIEMNRTLKKDKLCVIVIGNSSLEYELIESHKYFINFAQKVGFEHIKTYFRHIDKSRKYSSVGIGQIDDEYIVVLKKILDTSSSASDDKFIAERVKEEMKVFAQKVESDPGSSTRGKTPPKERLLKNIDKLNEAIKTINEDIRIKDSL